MLENTSCCREWMCSVRIHSQAPAPAFVFHHSRVCMCLGEVWFCAAIVTCAMQKVTHGCLFTWFSMQKETHDCLWRLRNEALQVLIFLYVESSGICFRLSAVVFSRSVLSPVLENTACCQELMCNVGICWWPSLATHSQWRKKPMIVCEGSKVRRFSCSFVFM